MSYRFSGLALDNEYPNAIKGDITLVVRQVFLIN